MRRGIAAVIDHIRTLPDCAGLDVKYSDAPAMPFHRMKVRLKREIVTMGVPDIDPRESVGTYVEPEDWNELIADPDTIVIDTRNDYEVAVGTFDARSTPDRQLPANSPAGSVSNALASWAGASSPGRDVLHRRHPLREIDRLSEARGR